MDNFLNNNFMKYKLLLMTLFACGLGWGQDFNGTYSFASAIGNVASLSYNGSAITNLTVGALTKTGVTTSSSSGNSRASGWGTGSADAGTAGGSIDLSKYFEFTITADSGYTISNPTLTYGVGRSGTGTRRFEWRWSIDSYGSALSVGTVNGSITHTSGILETPDANSGYTGNVITTSTSNQTTITFRFYAYGAESNTGTGGLQGNLTFGGTLVANGSSASTTWNGTSWSNSAPTASIDAIIDGDLTTTADLTCKDLTINSGKTLTIAAGNKLTVSGNLINNGTIVFKSNSTSTAMFDTFSGTLSGSGVTTVEPFIPARRAYRFLSPSLTTSTTIRQNWQENGGTAAGLGTHITGTGGATNGFDPTETNNSSLLLFTNGAWVGATSTNVSLTAGNAYCLMVRGDRTTDLTSNTPTASNTVLRATGTLFTGNFTPALSAAASGYSFIGNPYQAPLDIKTALQSSTDVNKNVVYYWDPTINARGGYITRNLQTSQNSPTSSVNDYVQPGQAFFVVNEPTLTSTPALTFTENHKSVVNAAAGVFRTANTNEYGTLRVNLQANTNNQWATIDGALAIFNDTFSWNVTSEDATKMANLDEDVSFVQNNTNLAIALQSNPSATSELPIKIDKMRHTNYQWKFELDNYNGATPFLFDTLNNSYTQINNGTVVPFTADANTTNRFKIVFQNAVLSNATFQNTLAIYPNPAKAGASFYIEGVSEATVTVSNLLGQTVPVQTKSQGTTLQVIPNNSLSQGVYLVNITSEGNTQQVKWIVE